MARRIAVGSLALVLTLSGAGAAVDGAEADVGPQDPGLLVKQGIAADRAGDHQTALARFRAAADRGYPPAQTFLAGLYTEGRGVRRDLTRARLLYEAAARQEFAPALFNLGMMASQGIGMAKSNRKAVAYFERAAQAGHIYAMFNLGQAHRKGLGTPVDLEAAAQWYAGAAKFGMPQAMNEYGLMLVQAQGGLQQDTVGGLALFYAAAALGYGPAAKNAAQGATLVNAADRQRALERGQKIASEFAAGQE